MEKEKIIALWADKLAGEISEENHSLLSEALRQDDQLAAELADMARTWQQLDAVPIPEPSASMDASFQDMMSALAEKSNRPMRFARLLQALQVSWQPSLAFLIIGILVGWFFFPTQSQEHSIKQLSEEVHTMKEMMMLSMIAQPKAQERIKAVQLVSDLPTADTKVINALLLTLKTDKNINVRLASLDALTKYASHAGVRSGVIEAISHQDSPIMQIALAEALVVMQEKSSIDALDKLEKTVHDEIVKEKIKESITKLENI